MAESFWARNGKILFSQGGEAIFDDKCCCSSILFVDLIELQPMLNGHPANNMPNRPGQYDIQITFNYFNREYAVDSNLHPYTYTFPQFDYFHSNSNIFQQTVPLNVGREAHFDFFKQDSKLIFQKIVSGFEEGDYSDVWHWNKFGDETANYLSTNLVIPDTPQFYQYISSITFNNVDYDLLMNTDLSLQRQQFSIPSAAQISHTWYYNYNDSDGFKTYTNRMHDRKQYYAARVISADTTGYSYSGVQPDDAYDISDITVFWQSIGGTLNRPQAGNYVYIGTVDGGQRGLIKIDQKYYYHQEDYGFIIQYKDSVTSCQVVPCAYYNQYSPNSKYYTGLAFEYNNQTKYIYSKPSSVSVYAYNYASLSPDTYQIEIKTGYYTQYGSYKHPLEFDSSSGWYFATYYDSSDPEDNRYVWLNDYTEASPPLYWQENGVTYYTHNGPYYISDTTWNQITVVLTGESYIAAKDSYFYEVKFDSTTSSWYYITDPDYPQDYTYTLSGGSTTQPPPYNYLGDNQIVKVSHARWWKHDYDDSVHILIDGYYDIRFGDLVNIYSNPPYYGRQNTHGNRVMQNAKYLHRNMSPFIKCQTIRYEWDDDRINGSTTAISTFLTSPNLETKVVTPTNMRSYNSNQDNPAAVQFGLDDGYNDNISITTFRMNKPTIQQIEEGWYNYYDNTMSSVLDNLCGVYCQILTGVYIMPNSESPNNIYLRNMQYQFRANGTFYQTLQFGQEYYFCPYLLQEDNVLDVLSTQEGWDDYLTTLKAYSSTYNSFENNFKGNIIYDKFLDQISGINAFMACFFIRPISGVTSLDGSQLEHLAPARLTDQQPI